MRRVLNVAIIALMSGRRWAESPITCRWRHRPDRKCIEDNTWHELPVDVVARDDVIWRRYSVTVVGALKVLRWRVNRTRVESVTKCWSSVAGFINNRQRTNVLSHGIYECRWRKVRSCRTRIIFLHRTKTF